MRLDRARRIALTAQSLASPRPKRVTHPAFLKLFDTIGLSQIDSINVLARAHLMPAYSRLGGYDVAHFERAAAAAELVEVWAHEATIVPTAIRHWLRPRMARAAEHPFWATPLAEHPRLAEGIVEAIGRDGPLTARQLQPRFRAPSAPKTSWGWNWSVVKRVCEALFALGRLTALRRTPTFERLYDLPERVFGPLPPPPSAAEATTELVRAASRALGIGSLNCFADYYRLRRADTHAAVQELLAAGELERVRVQGWDDELFLRADHDARRARARALLAPFDPLVFTRERLLRLFGMHYRIGTYTPAAKRTHGYYVLPFLLGDRLVGRTDLKADRATGRLLVRTAFAEEGAPADAARELAAELAELAAWLGLGQVTLADDAAGDLVGVLAKEL